MTLVAATVCSGIGAPECASRGLPIRWAWCSEIEPFPSAVLAHHFPETPNRGDFTRIGPDAGPVDLLVGGTPCQSFSVAGQRAGLDDPRGDLALEYVRLAVRLRARWLAWENVPGVLSTNGGRDFGAFLRALELSGYGWAYRTLDAQYFGVAQRRRRVFVVASLGGWAGPAAVLFERASLRWDSAPSRGSGTETAGALMAGASGRGWRVGADEAAAGHVVAHTLRGEGFDASEDGTGRGTPIIPFDLAQVTSATNRTACRPGDPNGTLARTGRPHVAFNARQDPDVSGERHAAPMGTVRRLTPRECERLQGFPDDWTAVPFRGRPAADGPRYKAIGNSMAVPVMRWILERLVAVDAIQRDAACEAAGMAGL